MARQYSVEKIRKIIGQDDTSNSVANKRIREAGELSQAEFERETANLTITYGEKERELINFGGSAYFYQLENADDTLTKKYTDMIRSYITTAFGRPKMKTRGPL